MTGARQATPTAGALGERTRPYGVWSICAHPITGVNPYSRRYCLHSQEGKGYFPLDWCKAGNAHRRCPRRAHKTIRSVVYLCAPHNWGEPILPEILHTSQEGKGYFPLDWCKAGNAHRRCPRRAHKTIRSVVYLCAPHNWGEPILPEIQKYTSQEGKGYFLLTGARQATPTAGASESAQDHTECGLSVRTP